MNNSQFRKLVLDTPARKPASADKSNRNSNGAGVTPSATGTALGSRMRSSIPMTPRTVKGYNHHSEFSRQLLAQQAASAPTKKFRSTAAPKGAKLPEGYVDRAKQIREGEEEEESDKVTRIKALEEMMKLGQIDERTFVKLREDILGDEVKERAGVVKGLDYALLERVRKGEVGVVDMLEGKIPAKREEERENRELEVDVDDEFEKLEGKEVEAVVKEKEKKKGEMAPPALTGRKRNRDQILAELKAQRAAAKAAQQPALGARFHKVGERKPGDSRIERDSKGREVLITIDEDGNEKRKVRKVQIKPEQEQKDKGLLMPNKDAKPLGMEVPDIPKEPEEEDDMDIFEGAGDDYDPLAGLDDSSSEDEGEVPESGDITTAGKGKGEEKPKPEPGSMPPPPPPKPTSRNYFGETKPSEPIIDPTKPAALSDPTLLAALKKASTLAPISSSSTSAEEAEEKAKAEKRRKMLQQDDRDAEDMDMGFGSSRLEDEADFDDGGKVKLSEWGRDDDEKGGRGGAKKERKRGGKKRKGDGESVADVMRVIEGRKKAG